MVLSGGTGTPKLLRGLKAVLDPDEVTVVVNTAEDVWISGNLVCPDLDTVLYTLGGIVDEEKWWGIAGDSFEVHKRLLSLGGDEFMAIGDLDRAIHTYRSNLIRSNLTLSETTSKLARALHVESKVIPMTDDEVATMITTPDGEIHFQEFWVGKKGGPEVLSMRIKGIEKARPSPGLEAALRSEDVVLIGPSNPITSIGPILALRGVKEAISKKNVIAISPLLDDRPYSGPASKFMKAVGLPVNDSGLRSLLGKVDIFVVSPESKYDGPCVRLNTIMNTTTDSIRVANSLVELIKCS